MNTVYDQFSGQNGQTAKEKRLFLQKLLQLLIDNHCRSIKTMVHEAPIHSLQVKIRDPCGWVALLQFKNYYSELSHQGLTATLVFLLNRSLNRMLNWSLPVAGKILTRTAACLLILTSMVTATSVGHDLKSLVCTLHLHWIPQDLCHECQPLRPRNKTIFTLLQLKFITLHSALDIRVTATWLN